MVRLQRLTGISFLLGLCSISQGQIEDFHSVLDRTRRACENVRTNVGFEKKDALWRVVSLDVFPSDNPDADLRQLRGLTTLESLNISESYKSGRTTHQGIEQVAMMRNLRVLAFPNYVRGDAVQAVCQDLPDLEELRLENCADIGDDDLLLIDKLVNLKRLDIRRKLGDHVISNKFLSHLHSLKKLQELSIVGIAGVTDSGIAEVKGLESLRRLDASQTGITLAGVVALKLPNLEDLSVAGYCDESQLASSLPNLRTLSIGLGKRKNREGIRLPENLRQLMVTQTGNAPEFQPSPQHLEYVSVYGPNFGKGMDLDWFGLLPGLTELRILADGDKSIMAAARCKNLRSLTIAECSPPSEGGLEFLAKMPELESLAIFSGGRITDRALGSIANLAALRSLELGSLDGVTTDGIKTLTRLSELKSLSLEMVAGRSIGPFDAILAQFTSLTKLERLSLHNAKITDQGMKALSTLKKLRRLDLTGSSGFTDDSLANLVVALPQLQIINRSYSPPR